MTPRNRADRLTAAAILVIAVLVFYVVFGATVARALGWQP